MPRPEDIAWKFVIRRGKKWRCPYCKIEYSGSVTRVKSHFLKQPKEGIASCTEVPEHISTLMELLHNQVRNREDIAWKFVDRLGDNKWRCHHCREEFFGDLTGVKGHLLGVPNERISICIEVPDHVRTLMRSLLNEVAEEESRGANGQSSTEPQSRHVPAQAEVAEGESREANSQFSTGPQSRERPTQAEVAEEESRDANSQFFTEPQGPLFLPEFFSPNFLEHMEQLTDIGLNSAQQSQPDSQFHQSSTMPLLAQSSHGESSTMASTEEGLNSLNLLYQPQCSIQSQMQMNDQQTLARPSSCQYDQSPAVGKSNCLQDCNQPCISSRTSLTNSIPHSYGPLPSCHEASGTVTSSIPPQDPSSSQLQPARQPQGVRHQSIDHKTRNAHQNPTMSLDVAYDEIASSVPQLASLSLDPSEPQVHLDQPTHEMGNEQYAQVLDSSTSNVPWKFTAGGITSHPSTPGWSTLFNSLPESRDVNVNTSEEMQINELHNPTAGLQNDSSLDVDGTNRLQDSQLCVVEVIPVLSRVSNTSPPNTVQHPNQLHPRCDKGDGNDTRFFPRPTPMNIEPSIVSPHSSNSHNFEATIDNLQVQEPETNTTGPSSLQAPVSPQHQSVPHQSETRNVLQNPTPLSSTALMDMDSRIPSSSQAPNNAPHGPTGISNFNQQDVTGQYYGQQSQAERQFPQSSTMPSLVQNSHGDSTSCSTDASLEEVSYLLASPHQPQCSFLSPYTVEMPMNGQQTPTGASSSQDNQLRSVGNSNCSQDCNKHSQLQTPTDIDSSIASQHTTDSHVIEATIVDLQVPELATNTIGPSSSQDMNRGSPVMNVRRTPQTRGSMEQMMPEDRAVDIANLPLNGATSYSSASPPPNSFFPNSPNEPFPFLTESLTLNTRQNPSAPLPSQNRQLLDNTSQNESQGSILPGVIASDAQLTNVATTNTPQHFNQPVQIFHKQCEGGTSLSPPRASMDIEPPLPSQPFNGPPIIEPFNSPLQIPEGIVNTTGPSTSEDSRGICPVTALQPTSCPHIEATLVNLQVLENGANMAGPSLSQVQPALVPPRHQSVSHQFISPETRNAQQNPTGLSSSQKNHRVPCHPHAPMHMGLMGPSSLLELDMNKGVPLMSHTNIDNNFEKSRALKRKIKRLYSREADIGNEVATSLSLKKPRMEVKNWLADVENLRNDFHRVEATSENCLPPHQQVDILMQEAEELIKEGEFPKGLFVGGETRVSKLLERKSVGEAFQTNTTEILEYLVGNQISRLGIYGMGGVGKTTLMVHIHNRLIEKANYDNVLWITVSQGFNIEKLQDDIWKALDLGVLQEKDVRKRAAMLFDCLTKKGKLVIILDDVWDCFDLEEEVGIPVRAHGFKFILTTRSFDVCRQMQCQEKIKIEPLSQEEAENLFLEELGPKMPLNLEIEAIMKSIVKECAGLPIGVIMMAKSMREVTDVFQWRDSLMKLKESSMGQTDMEKKLLMNLKVSYDRLGNPNIQQCFLSCALYPEDEFIDEFELIEFFIDQGLIAGPYTRNEQYDKGLSILKMLGNACLLEYDGGEVKMHDLLRDMALHIMGVTSMVKAGKGLKGIPPEEYWTDALEKVSLMESKISEIPLNMSTNCPNLSTLLLNGSLSENVVLPDSFFKRLCGLKVLNLSGCELIELPNSFSNLVNLRALLLRGCSKLRRIPYLGKLTSLRKLNVSDCSKLEEVPEGLEMLVNLRYLELRLSSIFEFREIVKLPERVLGGLLNLRHLQVDFLDGQDMTNLRALETLECSFEDANDFNKCVRVIEQSNSRCYYDLRMVQKDYCGSEEFSCITLIENPKRIVEILGWDHAIVSVGGECTGIFILIPQDVQRMTMNRCDGITNLSGMGPLEYLESLCINELENLRVLCGGHEEEAIDIQDSPAPTLTPPLPLNLRYLQISNCPKLKYLFGYGSKSNLPHLRRISIYRCEEIVGIIAAVTSPPPHLLPFFPSLVEISIDYCNKMKRAVESEWMPHFPTLRSIKVSYCEKMEEIIGGPPPYSPVDEISFQSLQVDYCDNMRKLFPREWLLHLQNLQSIEVARCKIMVEMISGVGQGQEGSITTSVNNTPSSFQPFSISLPKLKSLELRYLPQLKSICEVPISCDSMKRLNVYGCPELKRIPLQLPLREIEELPYIRLEDEEKWKTLMWGHRDAQAILQPYLRKWKDAIELNTKAKDLQRLCS